MAHSYNLRSLKRKLDFSQDVPSCGDGSNGVKKKKAKKQRTTAAQSSPRSAPVQGLLDLPNELLQNTLCSYLSTAPDRFALQATNKSFREISNSRDMLQSLKLLKRASVVNDSQTFPAIIGDDDSVESATARLIPFAQTGNADALLVLGLIATYVEDDLEAGMALFQKGSNQNDNRAKYELAILLMLSPNNAHHLSEGKRFIQEAATAKHAPSLLFRLRRKKREQHCELTKREMRTTKCLDHLLAKKAEPPQQRWKPYKCGNSYCIRRSYRKWRKRRTRAWLRTKTYSTGWLQYRSEVLACGVPSPYFDRDLFFCVGPLGRCAGCRSESYCSRTCQILAWSVHKQSCQR